MAKIENEYLLQDFLEVSVANYYSYDAVTGLEYYSGTLESHELTQKTTSEDIKGGQNNDTIATIDKDKTLELKIIDVIARQDIQALRLGTAVKLVGTDVVDAFHMPKNYTITTDASNLVITLDETPKVGETVAVYNSKTGKLILPAKAVILANKITITESGLVAGDTVYVTGFKYSAKATDKYSQITTGSSTPTLYTVIEVPLFDEDVNIKAYKQYIFPRTKMSGDVTLSGKTERTKSTDTSTIKILKDNSLDYLGRIIYRTVV